VDIVVHALAMCYEIYGVLEIRNVLRETDVDLVVTVQKAQRSILNFKSASIVLLKILSGGPILSIFDIHWTTIFSGFYKLNVDVACLIKGDGYSGIGVVVRDNEGVVVVANCRQVFSLPDSEVAKALAMRESLKFTKACLFRIL